jgi:hypothetical protein
MTRQNLAQFSGSVGIRVPLEELLSREWKSENEISEH